MNPLRTGPWRLSDLNDVKPNGLKVFSCFHCGGGSTMGYKLAGYEVLGGVDIDKDMVRIYRKNHKPKYSFRMGIQGFNQIPDEYMPKELFELDILDGSPPCSSFSMAGAREKKWGVETKFREGQAVQVLDDLFFHFIETAKRLKPKIVVAENVKGMLAGNARFYVKQIFKQFDEAGYDCQLFLLNASRMGVPQRRERTFFIARRKNLNLHPIDLKFNEPEVSVGFAFNELQPELAFLTPERSKLWELVKVGERFNLAHPKGSDFGTWKLDPSKPSPTILSAGGAGPTHWGSARWLSKLEFARLQSFPDNYNFLSQRPQYVCGMSVPPFMMQRVADQIYKQWFVSEAKSEAI